jgi:hypothetical protein
MPFPWLALMDHAEEPRTEDRHHRRRNRRTDHRRRPGSQGLDAIHLGARCTGFRQTSQAVTACLQDGREVPGRCSGRSLRGALGGARHAAGTCPASLSRLRCGAVRHARDCRRGHAGRLPGRTGRPARDTARLPAAPVAQRHCYDPARATPAPWASGTGASPALRAMPDAGHAVALQLRQLDVILGGARKASTARGSQPAR